MKNTKHKIIDPHIHLFDLSQGQYQWLKSHNPPYWPDKNIIQKNFTESDLILNNHFNLEGLVHIEAGFDNVSPVAEINFLKSSVKKIPFQAISYIDMALPSTEFKSQLDILQKKNELIGIRHIMEGDDIDLIFNKSVFNNLTSLAEYQLIFEAQFEIHNLDATEHLIKYATELPNLKIVINHCGLVTKNKYEQWQQAISLLTPFSNIYIKCSGWEMDNRQYKQVWVKQIINYLLANFGEDRIMLASNFPLCLFSKSYTDLWQSYYDLNLPNNIWQAMSYQNAKEIYQVKAKPSIIV